MEEITLTDVHEQIRAGEYPEWLNHLPPVRVSMRRVYEELKELKKALKALDRSLTKRGKLNQKRHEAYVSANDMAPGKAKQRKCDQGYKYETQRDEEEQQIIKLLKDAWLAYHNTKSAFDLVDMTPFGSTPNQDAMKSWLNFTCEYIGEQSLQPFKAYHRQAIRRTEARKRPILTELCLRQIHDLTTANIELVDECICGVKPHSSINDREYASECEIQYTDYKDSDGRTRGGYEKVFNEFRPDTSKVKPVASLYRNAVSELLALSWLLDEEFRIKPSDDGVAGLIYAMNVLLHNEKECFTSFKSLSGKAKNHLFELNRHDLSDAIDKAMDYRRTAYADINSAMCDGYGSGDLKYSERMDAYWALLERLYDVACEVGDEEQPKDDSRDKVDTVTDIASFNEKYPALKDVETEWWSCKKTASELSIDIDELNRHRNHKDAFRYECPHTGERGGIDIFDRAWRSNGTCHPKYLSSTVNQI